MYKTSNVDFFGLYFNCIIVAIFIVSFKLFTKYFKKKKSPKKSKSNQLLMKTD